MDAQILSPPAPSPVSFTFADDAFRLESSSSPTSPPHNAFMNGEAANHGRARSPLPSRPRNHHHNQLQHQSPRSSTPPPRSLAMINKGEDDRHPANSIAINFGANLEGTSSSAGPSGVMHQNVDDIRGCDGGSSKSVESNVSNHRRHSYHRRKSSKLQLNPSNNVKDLNPKQRAAMDAFLAAGKGSSKEEKWRDLVKAMKEENRGGCNSSRASLGSNRSWSVSSNEVLGLIHIGGGIDINNPSINSGLTGFSSPTTSPKSSPVASGNKKVVLSSNEADQQDISTFPLKSDDGPSGPANLSLTLRRLDSAGKEIPSVSPLSNLSIDDDLFDLTPGALSSNSNEERTSDFPMLLEAGESSPDENKEDRDACENQVMKPISSPGNKNNDSSSMQAPVSPGSIARDLGQHEAVMLNIRAEGASIFQFSQRQKRTQLAQQQQRQQQIQNLLSKQLPSSRLPPAVQRKGNSRSDSRSPSLDQTNLPQRSHITKGYDPSRRKRSHSIKRREGNSLEEQICNVLSKQSLVDTGRNDANSQGLATDTDNTGPVSLESKRANYYGDERRTSVASTDDILRELMRSPTPPNLEKIPQKLPANISLRSMPRVSKEGTFAQMRANVPSRNLRCPTPPPALAPSRRDFPRPNRMYKRSISEPVPVRSCKIFPYTSPIVRKDGGVASDKNRSENMGDAFPDPSLPQPLAETPDHPPPKNGCHDESSASLTGEDSVSLDDSTNEEVSCTHSESSAADSDDDSDGDSSESSVRTEPNCASEDNPIDAPPTKTTPVTPHTGSKLPRDNQTQSDKANTPETRTLPVSSEYSFLSQAVSARSRRNIPALLSQRRRILEGRKAGAVTGQPQSSPPTLTRALSVHARIESNTSHTKPLSSKSPQKANEASSNQENGMATTQNAPSRGNNENDLASEHGSVANSITVLPQLAPPKRDNPVIFAKRPLTKSVIAGRRLRSPATLESSSDNSDNSSNLLELPPNEETQSTFAKDPTPKDSDVIGKENNSLHEETALDVAPTVANEGIANQPNLDEIRASIVKLKYNGVGGVGKSTSTLVRNVETGRYIIRDVDDAVFEDKIKAEMGISEKPDVAQEEEIDEEMEDEDHIADQNTESEELAQPNETTPNLLRENSSDSILDDAAVDDAVMAATDGMSDSTSTEDVSDEAEYPPVKEIVRVKSSRKAIHSTAGAHIPSSINENNFPSADDLGRENAHFTNTDSTGPEKASATVASEGDDFFVIKKPSLEKSDKWSVFHSSENLLNETLLEDEFDFYSSKGMDQFDDDSFDAGNIHWGGGQCNEWRDVVKGSSCGKDDHFVDSDFRTSDFDSPTSVIAHRSRRKSFQKQLTKRDSTTNKSSDVVAAWDPFDL